MENTSSDSDHEPGGCSWPTQAIGPRKMYVSMELVSPASVGALTN